MGRRSTLELDRPRPLIGRSSTAATSSPRYCTTPRRLRRSHRWQPERCSSQRRAHHPPCSATDGAPSRRSDTVHWAAVPTRTPRPSITESASRTRTPARRPALPACPNIAGRIPGRRVRYRRVGVLARDRAHSPWASRAGACCEGAWSRPGHDLGALDRRAHPREATSDPLLLVVAIGRFTKESRGLARARRKRRSHRLGTRCCG